MTFLYFTPTLPELQDAFYNKGRGDQFSACGLRVLYDYLQEIADSMGEPIELDVIGLCCDFYEVHIDDIDDDCDPEREIGRTTFSVLYAY